MPRLDEQIHTAVQHGDIDTAKSLLRRLASGQEATFTGVYQACRELLAIDQNPDTFQAVAYGLWEIGIPPTPVPESAFVDFILFTLLQCDNIIVVNYVLLLVESCIEAGCHLTFEQMAVVISLRDQEWPGFAREPIDIIINSIESASS